MKLVPADLGKYKILLFGAGLIIVLLLIGTIEVTVPADWWMYAGGILAAYILLTRKKPEKLYVDSHDIVVHITNQELFRPPGRRITWDNPVILRLGDLWIIQPSVNEPTFVYDIHGVALQCVPMDPIKLMRSIEASDIASGELREKIKGKTIEEKAKEAGYIVTEKDEEEEEE